MSDSYDVNGVTITPAAGGYYDLSHSTLPDGTERVQGKEKAETRAAEVAEAAKSPDGRMDGNPQLNEPVKLPSTPPTTDGKVDGDDRTPAQKAIENEAVQRGMLTATEQQQLRDAAPTAAERDEELAALRAQVKEHQDRVAELEKAAAPMVKTVGVNDEPEAAIPAHVPRHFAGQMDDKTKASLKKAGIATRTIVLEESESIPPTGLFIGHNGRSYMIKPGEEVDVPEFLTDILDDAVMAAPIVDSQTQKVLGYRNRSKYPYRVVNTK